MSDIDNTLLKEKYLDDFIEEASEIIADIGASCVSLKRSKRPDRLMETIERGLHTIKGNAMTLGFPEFGEAASFVLDMVRTAKDKSDDSRLKQSEVTLVFQFLNISRQFLFLAKNSRKAKPDFFKNIIDMSINTEQYASGFRENNVQKKELYDDTPLVPKSKQKQEIEKILSDAPMVAPNLDTLVRMATDELSSGKSEYSEYKETLLSKEKDTGHVTIPPSDPGSKPQDDQISDPLEDTTVFEGSSSSHIYGYGFEAWSLYQTIKEQSGRQINGRADRDRSLSRVSEFLKSFSRWTIESQLVPLEGFLKDAAEWGEQLTKSLEYKIAVEVSVKGAYVLPDIGNFICLLLKKMLVILTPVRKRDQKEVKQVIINIKAESKPESLIISFYGHPSVRRIMTRKLQLYSIMHILEGIGGRIGQTSSNNDEIIIEIRDKNIYSMQVLLVRTNKMTVGIPLHRVLHIQKWNKHSTNQTGAVEYDNEKIEILNLDVGISDSLPAEDENETPSYIIIIGTDKRRQAVVADSIVQHKEMLIKPEPYAAADTDIVGSCISLEYGSSIPLLGVLLH